MDKHVALELGVVEEPLLAAGMGALEQLVTVHGHVLLQRRSITKDLSTGL